MIDQMKCPENVLQKHCILTPPSATPRLSASATSKVGQGETPTGGKGAAKSSGHSSVLKTRDAAISADMASLKASVS